MKKYLVAACLMAAAASAYAKDMKEFIVTTTPKMSCENCEKRIKGNLRFEKGVKKIETDLANQLVTITYDADKTSEEKIIEAFGKLDYQVSKVEPGKKCPSEATESSCCKNKK